MKPSLHHLIEEHFKVSKLLFWRSQKWHVCNKDGDWQLFEVEPKKCVMHRTHYSHAVAYIYNDKVKPRCMDGCAELTASDPDFFVKLDNYLERRCFEGCFDRIDKAASAFATAISPPTSGSWKI